MDTLAYLLYDAALWLLSPLLLAYYLFRAWKRGRPFTGFRERLGAAPRHLPPGRGGRLWLHAVSVGEVGVAAILLPLLRERRPDLRIAFSTVTTTGRDEATKLTGLESLFYLPFDFPFAVRRTLDRVRPDAVAIVETELWPNLIREAARRGIPVVVVNGRLSERSFGRYRMLRALLRPVLRRLTAVAARGETDAAHFRALGVQAVHVAGNVKYDAPEPLLPEGLSETRSRFGLPRAGAVLVAGSTHPGEEEAVAAAYAGLRLEVPDLSLLVAPRHLERLAQVENALAGAGLDPLRWSRIAGGEAGDNGRGRVVILDAMGMLGEAYAVATAAFIGGSLIPHGGQNPIEAARWGVPVVFGPHMENFAEVADMLIQAGGAIQVETPKVLQLALHGWFADAGARDEAGRAAREVIRRNRGAAGRTVNMLFEAIDRARGARQ